MTLELLVIAGAPGSGKTTLSRLLFEEFTCPYIELGYLRQFHLDYEWSNMSEREESMSFENMLFLVRNYFRHGYRPVILADLEDFRVQEIPRHFQDVNFKIATLIVADDAELKRRVLLPERDSGYRDYASSIAWNHDVIERPAVQNEIKVDNTNPDPTHVLRQLRSMIVG